jgi:hypothetical protein
MTKSKRAFAAMLVDAQGFGDIDEISKKSLVDIIYELKKIEEKPEPSVVTKIKDFWSRLTHDSDDD